MAAPVDRKALARLRRIQAAENRQKAVEMRRMGLSYVEIGRQLGITHQSVQKTINKAMAELKANQDIDAEHVKTAELDRLDRMQVAAWPGAMKGNHLLIDKILKIMERRAKLLGLDAPQKVAPTNPTGDQPYSPPAREMTPEERQARIAELLEQRERGATSDGQ